MIDAENFITHKVQLYIKQSKNMGEIYLKEDLFTGTGGIVWGSDYAFPISYHKSMLEDTQRIQ